jgi:hypothetical protein
MDISMTVAHHVEQWKTRLTEAIEYWKSEGYRTGSLDRILAADAPPTSVESLLREFEGSVAKLRDLERQIRRLDTPLAAHDAFRDPERLSEAEQLLERALRTSAPPTGPSAAFTRAGFEVGTSNQLAVRTADAIVAVPGSRYNPLFIHGPSGVGRRISLNAMATAVAPTADSCGCGGVFRRSCRRRADAALQEERSIGGARAGRIALARRRAIRGGQGANAGRALPCLQRALRRRQAARVRERRPPRELSARRATPLAIRGRSSSTWRRRTVASRAALCAVPADLGVPDREMLSYLGDRAVSSVRNRGTANRIVASAEVKAVARWGSCAPSRAGAE